MEYEFEFDDLTPVINDRIVTGMMLKGTAILESANPYEPHEFYVSKVVLDGGLVLTPNGGVPNGHHSLTKDLFKAVADIIHNDKHHIGKAAQAEFGDAVDGDSMEIFHVDPRRYSALSGEIVRGANV